MTVDLSKHELELLDQALVAWVQEPMNKGMGTSLLGVMLKSMSRREGISDGGPEETKNEIKAFADEGKQREQTAIMLRAKLMQAVSRASEHESVVDTLPTDTR